MLTNYVGTYTINIMNELAHTYMRNKLIESFEPAFIVICALLVVVYLIYSVSKCCMEDIIRNGRGSRGW